MMGKFTKYIQSLFLEEIHSVFLFIPILMGIGAYVYLTYFFREYSSLPFVALGTVSVLAIILRKKHYINLVNMAIICLLIGFCSAEIRTAKGNLSLVQGENVQAYLEGRVDKIIRKPKSASIIIELNHSGMDRAIGYDNLRNVKKVSVKLTNLSEVPHKNDEVYVKAILNSPSPKVMKGAYDFQKDAFFKSLGGYGYAKTKLYFLSRAKTSYLDKVKNTVRGKIDAVATNKTNAQLMKALMIGEKKGTTKATVEDFRASGIAHLLSISGLHIALIFGFIFLFLRYLFAFNQRITLNYDIKKICASIAIAMTFCYVVLVGAPMPTVRAFIMIFVIFLGILFNRRALSMRNVAIAGILILLVAPQSILSASFQMSFSAVIALVAAYEYISKKGIAFIGLKGYFWGVMFTSLIAILATAPFAVYNFQNFSPYGIITNALVMPIVSLALMPFIVLSYILLPFGLIELPLVVVNASVSSIAYLADYIANLQYSYLVVPTLPGISLTMFIVGGLFLCVFKHKLKFIGLIFLALAIITNFTNRDLPDVIISPNNEVIAVRRTDGLLSFSIQENEQFVANIIAKINGQKELIPFSKNDIKDNIIIEIKDNNEVVINGKVLDKKIHAQQIYVEHAKFKILDVK